jgi:hypothetical protein
MIGSPMALSSNLPQGRRVDGHHRDDRKPENHEREIQHGCLLAGAFYLCAASSFDFDLLAAHKDIVRLRDFTSMVSRRSRRVLRHGNVGISDATFGSIN